MHGRITILLDPNDNLFKVDRATQVGAEAIQVIYNRLDRKAEQGLLQSCLRQDLGVLARVPLGCDCEGHTLG